MRKVSLDHLNRSKKEYSDFKDYLLDFKKNIKQIIWSWKKLSSDERMLAKSNLRLNARILLRNMENKFNATDIKEWETSYARLEKLAKSYMEKNPLIIDCANKLYKSYESLDKKENQKGRLNFSIILNIAYGDNDLLELWD